MYHHSYSTERIRRYLIFLSAWHSLLICCTLIAWTWCRSLLWIKKWSEWGSALCYKCFHTWTVCQKGLFTCLWDDKIARWKRLNPFSSPTACTHNLKFRVCIKGMKMGIRTKKDYKSASVCVCDKVWGWVGGLHRRSSRRTGSCLWDARLSRPGGWKALFTEATVCLRH